jgi:hypothetical protein
MEVRKNLDGVANSDAERKIAHAVNIVNDLRYAGRTVYQKLAVIMSKMRGPEVEDFRNLSLRINHHHETLYKRMVDLIEQVRDEAINARNENEDLKESFQKLGKDYISSRDQNAKLRKEIAELKSHDIRLTHA